MIERHFSLKQLPYQVSLTYSAPSLHYDKFRSPGIIDVYKFLLLLSPFSSPQHYDTCVRKQQSYFTLQLHISDEELAERLRHVKPLIKPRTPSLAKYAALVTSADRGAILEIPDAIDPVRQTR